MNYMNIEYNCFNCGDGVSVNLFISGCDLHCPGCHNPDAQNFLAGQPFTNETVNNIIEGLHANGVSRNLSIMGGEPLHHSNQLGINYLIHCVKKESPQTPIYLWTGYTFEYLFNLNNPVIDYILQNIDYLIDGPYIQEERDITLKWRGSANQRIFDKEKILLYYKRKGR